MWVIRIWYGVLSLWALSMARGVVMLVLGKAAPGDHFISGMVTALKLLAMGGVLGICWTGGRSVVAFQAVVVGLVGWSGSDLLDGVHPADDTPVASTIATVALWMLPLVLLRPHPGELLRLHARPSAILLPLAVIPMVIYAVRQGNLPSIQHNSPTSTSTPMATAAGLPVNGAVLTTPELRARILKCAVAPPIVGGHFLPDSRGSRLRRE